MQIMSWFLLISRKSIGKVHVIFEFLLDYRDLQDVQFSTLRKGRVVIDLNKFV